MPLLSLVYFWSLSAILFFWCYILFSLKWYFVMVFLMMSDALMFWCSGIPPITTLPRFADSRPRLSRNWDSARLGPSLRTRLYTYKTPYQRNIKVRLNTYFFVAYQWGYVSLIFTSGYWLHTNKGTLVLYPPMSLLLRTNGVRESFIYISLLRCVPMGYANPLSTTTVFFVAHQRDTLVFSP